MTQASHPTEETVIGRARQLGEQDVEAAVATNPNNPDVIETEDIDAAVARKGRAVLGRTPEVDEGSTAVPPWVRWPKGLNPPKNRIVYFVRFPARFTSTPHRGDPLPAEDEAAIKLSGFAGARWRQCIIWEMSTGDQKMAINRAMNDRFRFQEEMTKQMVRAIDGVIVDTTGGEVVGNLDVWWEQIGMKCRQQLQDLWVKLHRMDEKEQVLFFESCIAARSMGT